MILDSGERTKFDSGAVRDIKEGKGRCDLMPLDVVTKLLNDDIIIVYIYEFLQEGKIGYLFECLAHFEKQYYTSMEEMLLEVSVHFEEGALKYGEWNWQKGIPQKSYIDSAIRHYLKVRRGDQDEDHARAFVWNIMCLIWTAKHINKDNKMEGK